MSNPIILIKNVKTGDKAFAYMEVYNSAVTILNGQPLTEETGTIDCSDALFEHVKYMSNLLNNAIRGRVDISVKPA